MYTPFLFEGHQIPTREALADALLDDRRRPWLVRAAVENAGLADAVDEIAIGLLASDDPHARGVALQLGRALMTRALISAVLKALERPEGLVGCPDPQQPRQTLAQSAVDYLVEVRPRGHRAIERALRAAMAFPELRTRVWDALSGEDPEAMLPHLAELIEQAPELARAVATRYALVHTEHCEAASEAVIDLSPELKAAFGEALNKHLTRIHAIKRWVACRRILFGK